MTKRKGTTIRLDADVRQQVDMIAKRDNRSANWVINQLCRYALVHLADQPVKQQVELARMADSDN